VKNKRIAYYHCSYPHGCGKYSEAEDLEEKVADKFKELELAPEFIDRVVAKARAIFYERRKVYDKKRKGLVNQRTAHEGRIRVLEERVMDKNLSGFNLSELKSKETAEIARIDEQLYELERTHDMEVDIAKEVMCFTEDIYRTYQNASLALKRHYLGFFWQKFEVKEGVIITANPSLFFDSLLKLQQAFLKTPEKPKAKKANGSNEVILTNARLTASTHSSNAQKAYPLQKGG
jgi:hypothetical protein